MAQFKSIMSYIQIMIGDNRGGFNYGIFSSHWLVSIHKFQIKHNLSLTLYYLYE